MIYDFLSGGNNASMFMVQFSSYIGVNAVVFRIAHYVCPAGRCRDASNVCFNCHKTRDSPFSKSTTRALLIINLSGAWTLFGAQPPWTDTETAADKTSVQAGRGW